MSIVASETLLLSGSCAIKQVPASKSARRTRRAVRFDPEVPQQTQELEEGPPRLANGRIVVLEPARSCELRHLRGAQAKVMAAAVDGESVKYTVVVDGTNEVVEMPAHWVRAENILIPGISTTEFLPLAQILRLAPQFRVPVFQRRYCWQEPQWRELWESVLETLREGRNEKQPDRCQCHSLGRLLFYSQSDGSALVLDGQQRLTTSCVLLSVLADRLGSLGAEEAASQLSAALKTEAGEHRLVPTLDDRADFRSCLTETSPPGQGVLMEAKRFFAGLASALDLVDCLRFADALCNRLMALCFFLRDRESLQSVFENLTTQGPGLSGEQKAGVKLSALDLVRNFVFEHFSDEEAMRDAHALYWSPMENHTGGPDGLCEAFCGYLSCENDDLCSHFVGWWEDGARSVTANEACRRLQLLSSAVMGR